MDEFRYSSLLLIRRQHRERAFARPGDSRARQFEEVQLELAHQPCVGVFSIDGFYMEASRTGVAPYGLGYKLYEECLAVGPGWIDEHQGGRA